MQDGPDVGLIVKGGQDQDAHGQPVCADGAGDVDAGTKRHLDVEHGDVGEVLPDQAQPLFAVAGLGDDLDLAAGLEELADPLADDGMVVCQQNADRPGR